MSDTELAWAAGFFDGEGCSYLTKPTRKNVAPYVRVTVTQKRREPLERFLAAVGEGNVHGPDPRGIHYWMAGGRQQAERVMGKLWPYLSEPKREQYLSKREEGNAIMRRKPWGGHDGNAKLDLGQALAIREEYAAGGTTYQELANKYGVAKCTIGQIVRGESWTTFSRPRPTDPDWMRGLCLDTPSPAPSLS